MKIELHVYHHYPASVETLAVVLTEFVANLECGDDDELNERLKTAAEKLEGLAATDEAAS